MTRRLGATFGLLALAHSSAWAQAPTVSLGPQADGVELGYVKLVLLLASVSLAPALLAVITSFARIVVVLFFLRAGLGAQEIPPNYVMVGLAIILTLIAMGPTLGVLQEEALTPLLDGETELADAAQVAEAPLREFMQTQARAEDLALMVDLAGGVQPGEQMPITALAGAFVISELRAAFLIGFIIYLPFVVIDLVVASTLASVGMLSLPAPLLSLPFKVMLFLMVDGWHLLTDVLVRTIQ